MYNFSLNKITVLLINSCMSFSFKQNHPVESYCLFISSIPWLRRGLAIGSTRTFPGGLAAGLACCPVFFLLLFNFLPSHFVPK